MYRAAVNKRIPFKNQPPAAAKLSTHQTAAGMATTASKSQAPAKLPAAIGQFHPLSILGRGGQGIVYLCDDPNLNRKVALKTLRHRSRDPHKLLNEARNAARLSHPGIVSLFEIELDHEPPYLVYEFAPGQPLGEWIGKTELAINRIVQIMIRVLDAVHYAHEQGVIHRDLTPPNILVDDKDHPRILDFGISTTLKDSTNTGSIVGTANYMAPEVLQEHAPAPAADVFSVSVVLHELLSGKRLFEADNAMAVMYKILNERIMPPSLQRDGVDTKLDQIVMKGLEKDPASRFASAASMRDALSDYLQPEDSTEPDGTNRDSKTAIAFLLRRIARKPDFPAISQHISEINQKSGLRDRSDANELAGVILQDFALTTKLLKVVNSAVYGQYGGTISTVSRAVIILGFEQVRSIALGIIIFEHLKNGEHADQLKDAACGSFLSAMLARELCTTNATGVDQEVAFIAAMFHQLGRHLAIFYFPDEYVDIQAVMESKDYDEPRAAREILGVDFAELGMAIGREWNLPDTLVNAMRKPPAGVIEPAKTKDNEIAHLSSFANEVTEFLSNNDSEIDEGVGALIERYESCIKVSTRELKTATTSAIGATREYAGLISINLDSSPLLGRVARAAQHENENEDQPTARGSEAATTAQAAAGASGVAEPGETASAAASSDDPQAAGGNAEPDQRLAFLTNAISELTTAILEQAPINDMVALVLEAFYRALGFSHVLFMIRNPKQHSYNTRFGFGTDSEAIKAQFTYVISDEDNIFRQAIHKGRNAVIIDTSDTSRADDIPQWVKELTNPDSILVFSVLVNKKCIGLIYADTCDGQLQISAQELKLLNTLVKQLTLGMTQH